MPMLNIGSTKQLFFDDYLIESLVNAKQGLNPAVKVDDNPILRPERPWEGNFMRPIKVIFDPTDQIFKMWYASSTITVHLENGKPVPGGAAGLVLDTQGSVMCLATSEDGIHWERPSLGLVEFDGSTDNNILPEKEGLPSAPAFQDLHEKDPTKRYKALQMIGDTQTRGMQYDLFYSPDALNWTPYEGNPVIDTGQQLGRWAGRFQGWDPIRETYYVTMEASHHWRGPYGKRLIGRAESPDMIHWSEPEIILVPDEHDYPDTEFYSLPVFAYEGISRRAAVDLSHHQRDSSSGGRLQSGWISLSAELPGALYPAWRCASGLRLQQCLRSRHDCSWGPHLYLLHRHEQPIA